MLHENVIKNIANEITRNCHAKNIIVETDFVIYLVDLLLLNPKYNKLFSKAVNRNNLDYFVNSCVTLLIGGDTSINTLKIQHIVQTNYDKVNNLVEKHLSSIEACVQPLANEIFDAYPDGEQEMKKLFRKISIYIILTSGLGNPGLIVTLKEGIAALESVFSLEDLAIFLGMPRGEKMAHLAELVDLVSGVRLFNRDCKKGGEGIPDLPFDIEDASKACLASLSNSLITIMQRVNSLTSAIDDVVTIEEETGNLYLKPADCCADTIDSDDYKHIFSVLAFYRQYELIIRKLLSDVEVMKENCTNYVDKMKRILEELHSVVKYKAAVPVVTVFPIFVRLWRVWRSMQNEMYLISTVNKLTVMLSAQQECVKVPAFLKEMLRGRAVITDQQRLCNKVPLDEKISMAAMKNFVPFSESVVTFKGKEIQYLGFCAICMCMGALTPCNPQLGLMKVRGKRYGFCGVKMAARFSQDPDRYVNEALDYIRNHPHLINLLNVVENVCEVRHIQTLVHKVEAKIKLFEKEVQTDVHPLEENIMRHYSWNLWEHKRRACQWATIVNCRTHSTQTKYSHLRSEIHCQTVEQRDKCLQTKRDGATNVAQPSAYIWGLRGRYPDGQHAWNLTEDVDATKKLKPQMFTTCTWPCIPMEETSPSRDGEESVDLTPIS